MRGVLESSSVIDLCRGLAEASSTGVLELEGPTGDGSITFREGRVRSASSPAPSARLGDRLVNAALLSQEQLDQALARQAQADERTKLGAILVDEGLVSRDAIRVFVQEQILDAVFELVGWREGSYEFRRDAGLDEKLPVEIRVDQLLVEISRRQNEWSQIERVIPDLDMVPDFRTGGSSADAALEPDEFAMLASVDGRRSIRDLASHLGYSEFEAARIVYGLSLLGVIEIRDPAGDLAAASTSEETAPDAEDRQGVEDTEVEAEFVLSAEAPPEDRTREEAAPEDVDDVEAEEVDVGRALEEALLADDQIPEPRSRPTVRVHIEDDGTFPPPGARTEVGPDVDEPEPWTPDEPVEAEPTDDAVDDTPSGSATAPRRDLDDDEFEYLINQLAGAPPRPESETETPTPPDTEDESPPVAEEDEETGRGGSDVSEFLRELSRLAVEDEEEGSRAPEPSAPPARPRPEPQPPKEDQSQKNGKEDDDKKRRGFFGWGR